MPNDNPTAEQPDEELDAPTRVDPKRRPSLATSSVFAVAMPERIDHFRIDREIGRGGQGVVYEAWDTVLERKVALKVLGTAGVLSEGGLERFRRESGIASRFDHPGLCTVYATGAHMGAPYIAMRFVDGESLSVRIKKKQKERRPGEPPRLFDGDEPTGESSWRRRDENRSSPVRTAALFYDIACALDAAHEIGIVHRDIKPANIMLQKSLDPVILDFGMARDLESDNALTRTGDIFGTPAYMAPEQLGTKKPTVDRRTDVYALGVALYEALTFGLPFNEPTYEALYNSILTTTPKPPEKVNPEIPRDLSTIVAVAMERDPSRRYQSAADLAEDLRRFVAREPILARPMSGFMKSWRWAQREPFKATALLIAFLAAAAVGWGAFTYREFKKREAAQLAAEESARRRAALETAIDRGFFAYERIEFESGEIAIGGRDLTNESLAHFDEALAIDPSAFEAVAGKVLVLLRRRPEDAEAVVRPYLDDARLGKYARFVMDRIIGIRVGRVKPDTPPTIAVLDVDSLMAFLIGISEIDRRHRGYPSRAVDYLTKAALLSPRPRLIYLHQLAHAHFHDVDHPLRATVCETLAYLGRDSELSQFWLGLVLFRGDPEAARRAFERARDLGMNAAEAEAYQGLILGHLRRFPESIAAFRRALELRPGSVENVARLARTLIDADQPSEAVRLIEDDLRTGPSTPFLLNILGVAYQKVGRAADAKQCFEKSMEMRPDDIIHMDFVASFYASIGMIVEAEKILDRALTFDPHHRGFLELLAKIRIEKGDFDGARKVLDDLAQSGGISEAMCDNLAGLFRKTGRIEDALRVLRDGVAKYPESPTLHSALVSAYHDIGRTAEALEAAKDAARALPRDAASHFNVGLTAATLGRVAESEAAYREALKLRPDYPEAHCNIGLALVELGAVEEGLAHLERGHELGSRNPDWAYPSLEWVKEAQRTLETLREFESASTTDPAKLDLGRLLEWLRVARRTKKVDAETRIFDLLLPRLTNDAPRQLRMTSWLAAGETAMRAFARAGKDDRKKLISTAVARLARQLEIWKELRNEDGELTPQDVDSIEFLLDADSLTPKNSPDLADVAADLSRLRKLVADLRSVLEDVRP